MDPHFTDRLSDLSCLCILERIVACSGRIGGGPHRAQRNDGIESIAQCLSARRLVKQRFRCGSAQSRSRRVPFWRRQIQETTLQNRETRPGACHDRDASLGGYRLASCHHRLRLSVPGACDYRVELHHSHKTRGPEGRTDVLPLAAGMQCVLGAACITHDTLFDLADLPRIWAGSWP